MLNFNCMDKTPRELALKRQELAKFHNEKLKELAVIKKRKAFKMIELITEHGAVNKAERYYSTTEDGQKELELELVIRGAIEMMRATKGEIDVLMNESWGNF